MLYPPVAELLKNVDSRYLLVNVVAHRARQIAAEAEALQEELPEKPVTMAIQEVADGKLSGYVKDEYKNCRTCRACPAGQLVFVAVRPKLSVIANQCAHWGGNPPAPWNQVTITAKKRRVSPLCGAVVDTFPL